MDRQLLEKPFPKELIKSRPGAQGRRLAYVEGHEYIRRLNEAFDGNWSFEIEYHNILKDEVVVMGKLTAAGISKSAFGGSAIKRHIESGQPISLSDDLKAAATDALKKAGSLLGIGLHLHAEQEGKQKTRSEPKQYTGTQNRFETENQKATAKELRITERQLSAILSLARRLGISEGDIRTRAAECYASDLEALSKDNAGVFISVLSGEMNKKRGAA
jgi:hypothetical protein